MELLGIYFNACVVLVTYNVLSLLLIRLGLLFMIRPHDHKTILRKVGALLISCSIFVGVPMGVTKLYYPEVVPYQQKLEKELLHGTEEKR